MTKLERKEKQMQLEHLRARKAKADSLGPEVIARTRKTYDAICSEIARLERELAAGLGGALKSLTEVLHEALAWEWKADPWPICEAHAPALARRVDQLEMEMTAAYNMGKADRCMELIPKYRAALKEMHDIACSPPVQVTLLEQFMEVHDEKSPW